MKAVLIPSRLRVATAFLFLASPLAVVQLALLLGTPISRLAWKPTLAIAVVVLLGAAGLRWLIHRGWRWAFLVTAVLAALWILIDAVVAAYLRSTALGFFTLFLLPLFAGILLRVWRELGRSFFDPRMQWYHGLPKPIPELRCEVSLPSTPTESEATDGSSAQVTCRVCRFDDEGAFVFSEKSGPLPLPLRGQLADLRFTFRGHQARCTGTPIRVLEGQAGVGFMFRGVTPDRRKELGDLVEGLRGEGYVE